MTTAILNSSDQARRDQLEALIDGHLNDFIRVLAALAEIKRDRLWRSTHPSYEAFCKAKFEKAKSYGYELAAAGEILANLQESGIPDNHLPTSVAQYRPLAKLEPGDQPEAMKAAVAIAPGHKPTASHVARAADAVKAKPAPFESGKTVTVLDEASPHYGATVEVVDVEGVIVQARVGEATVPFLCNELSGGQLPPKPERLQPQPKPDRLEGLESALEVSQTRIEILEDLLKRIVDAAGKHIPQDLRAEADELLN